MFALVLLSIIKNSLDYIYSRNEQGENDFHTEKWKKKCNFCSISLFITNTLSISHLIKLSISFSKSV